MLISKSQNGATNSNIALSYTTRSQPDMLKRFDAGEQDEITLNSLDAASRTKLLQHLLILFTYFQGLLRN
jgi:hypothetical protein